LQLRQFTSGSGSVQLPEIDTRQFLQRVAMKSGQTLVISGFEQTDSNLRASGIGHPRNIFTGGSLEGQAGKEILVIVITPVVSGEQ